MTFYTIYDMDADGQEHVVATAQTIHEARWIVDKGLQSCRFIEPRIEMSSWPAPAEEVYDDIPF